MGCEGYVEGWSIYEMVQRFQGEIGICGWYGVLK